MIVLRLVAVACLTGIAAMAADAPTFNKDVLPILQKNCQECHRAGEVAPMSLLTYAEVRPWAKSIKAAVISRKMPPWFADPGFHFANDKSLPEADIATLAAWADQRFGGVSVKNVTVWQQGDAENAMNYWANGLDQKLVSLGAGKPAAAASAAN